MVIIVLRLPKRLNSLNIHIKHAEISVSLTFSSLSKNISPGKKTCFNVNVSS